MRKETHIKGERGNDEYVWKCLHEWERDRKGENMREGETGALGAFGLLQVNFGGWLKLDG